MELIDKVLIPNWTTKQILDNKIVEKASKDINAEVTKVKKEKDSALIHLSTTISLKSMGADFLVKLKDAKKGAIVEVQGESKVDLEDPRILEKTGYKLLEKIQKLCK
ncbi:MAG: hypothetical protein ACUVXA_09920 [Candidatus Jordarchaeum sp.]|uniref:hypothetical protein n=1 Tax=Candidatus Jordarchaeum sp. TaxID=2823881 RepID=UPI00404A6D27